MSDLEETLAFQLRAAGIQFEREFRFFPQRGWRFDFAFPELKIAAECEGGVWSNGRHVRGAGFTSYCIQYNAAALSGWRVFRFTSSMVTSGNALDMIQRALLVD